MHFFIAYFLGEISKFSAEISHRVSNAVYRLSEKPEISFNFLFTNKICLIQLFCHHIVDIWHSVAHSAIMACSIKC